jgi:hydrogenase maturation factor
MRVLLGDVQGLRSEAVKGVSELLALGSFYGVNEGRAVLVISEDEAPLLLKKHLTGKVPQ